MSLYISSGAQSLQLIYKFRRAIIAYLFMSSVAFAQRDLFKMPLRQRQRHAEREEGRDCLPAALAVLLCVSVTAIEPVSADIRQEFSDHVSKLARWRQSHSHHTGPDFAQALPPPVPLLKPGCSHVPYDLGRSVVPHVEGDAGENIIVIRLYEQWRDERFLSGAATFVNWSIKGLVEGSAYFLEVKVVGQSLHYYYSEHKVFVPSQGIPGRDFSFLTPTQLSAGKYELVVSVHDAFTLYEIVCVKDDAVNDVSIVQRQWALDDPESLIGKSSRQMNVEDSEEPSVQASLRNKTRCSAAQAEAIARQRPQHASTWCMCAGAVYSTIE